MCFKYIFYIVLALFAFCACSDDTDIPEGPAKRTLLVYIAGDNNLSSDGEQNIKNILKGAQDAHLDKGNLLVYFDSADNVPLLLKVKASSNGQFKTDTLQVYSEQNSLNVGVMNGIINDVVSSFPAESYGLILWSHGLAWFPEDLTGMLRSFGDDKGKQMEIEELAAAIPDHTFDFILFDACYMGSMEVVYELRNKAKYIIASPTEIFSNGFPYQDIIGPLFADTPDLVQVCLSFYDFYNQQSGLYRSGTVSLSSTAEVEQLAEMVREIVNDNKEAIAGLSVDEVQKLDYISYRYHLLYDFDDFISHIATAEQYERFKQLLSEVVIFSKSTPKATYGISGNPQVALEHFSGLSVYIPQADYPRLNNWYTVHTAWGKAVYAE